MTGGGIINTSERRRLHNTRPLCRARGLLKSGMGFYFLRLFCLPNEILREIWRPIAPAQELVNSIVRNRITRAVRLIFHSPTLPRRILPSSSACPRPPRASPPLFFLSAAELRDLERAAVRTHVHAFS